MSSACAVYDFRMNAEGLEQERLIDVLRQLAKQYVFQKEKGHETGYLHYQGRMSLIKKARKNELMKLWRDTFPDVPVPNYLEPTANAPKTFDYNCYASKADSRVGEVITDQIKQVQFVPIQYQNKMDRLYPYQQYIWDTAKDIDFRMINMIYCPKGNQGKSTIAALCELFGNGIDLPPVNDAEKLMQAACDICMAKNVRSPSPIFLDLPRAMSKERLNGIYTTCELIKKGKLYDMRYSYKEWWIHTPQVWVFSNYLPDLEMLSEDRWKIWIINENKELVPYSED